MLQHILLSTILITSTLIIKINSNPDITKRESATNSNTESTSLPPLESSDTNMKIQQLSNITVQRMFSYPGLLKIANIIFTGKFTAQEFYKLDVQLLSTCGSSLPSTLSKLIAYAVSLYDFLPLDVYFLAALGSLFKFLVVEGRDIGLDVGQIYVDYVLEEVRGIESFNIETLYQALLGAYLDFVKHFGFDICSVIDELVDLFANELILYHNA